MVDQKQLISQFHFSVRVLFVHVLVQPLLPLLLHCVLPNFSQFLLCRLPLLRCRFSLHCLFGCNNFADWEKKEYRFFFFFLFYLYFAIALFFIEVRVSGFEGSRKLSTIWLSFSGNKQNTSTGYRQINAKFQFWTFTYFQAMISSCTRTESPKNSQSLQRLSARRGSTSAERQRINAKSGEESDR